MRMNKPMLAGFCAVIAVVILSAFNGSEAVKLRNLRQSIGELHGLTANTVAITKDDVEALERELSLLRGPAAPGEDEPAVGPADISETAALVRDLLSAHHIPPERFKINGNSKEAENMPAEFVIRCAPPQFFSFLAEASKQQGIAISSLSIRSSTAAEPEAGVEATADITMRVRNRAPPQRELSQSRGPAFSQNAPDPAVLALAFIPPRGIARVPGPGGHRGAGSGKAAAVPETSPEVSPEADRAEPEQQYKPLGTIRDADGREYL
jgi:hypothetical protein